MIFDIFSDKVKIKFEVDGKPPQKSRWGDENDLVANFRNAASKAKIDKGLDRSLLGPVKLNLTIHAKNIIDRQRQETFPNDPDAYVGDLDNLVTGVCEYLQACPTNPGTKLSSFLTSSETDPKKEILIHDDAQFVEIFSRKIKSQKNYYHVEIVELTNQKREKSI